MATLLIPLLGYGIPILPFPLPLGQINGPSTALRPSLALVLGLLLVVLFLVHRGGFVLIRRRHEGR